MKQTSVKLPSGEYILAETKHGVWYDKPKGNWQLLGADPTALTEEEAGEIVEPLFTKDDINRDGRYHYEFDLNPMPYKNYLWNTKLDDGSQYSSVDQPTASLDSLAASLGVSKPYVILKNVEK